jgi:tRNA modification GTPase
MLHRHADPIVAIATAPGRGAVGIVRASGRDLGPLIDAVCARPLKPREATYLPFWAADGGVIDQGLALHFPAPHSYTGEEVLELQAHGGPVLLQLLLARCLEAGAGLGLRVAEPGEFTQRAFLNDKLDLAQAEAVADLIEASTEAAARSAGRALAGAFSREVGPLRDRLIELRMLVEATLDFPEEEIDFLQQARARERLDAIADALQRLRSQARQGVLLREGLRVVLAGQPNVGKSSLLNALAGAELAIVTPIAGTTRDKVSETLQIEGVPLHIVDTAGLRDADQAHDEVERLGMQRSWGAIGEADVVLFVHDLTRLGEPVYDAAEAAIAARLPGGVAVLHVFNKADAAQGKSREARGITERADGHEASRLITRRDEAGSALWLSAQTGEGLESLRQALLAQAGWQGGVEGVFIARTRHLDALARAGEHVARAQALAARQSEALDLLAEELRLAHQALACLLGHYGSEDLLGDIFSRFCIGK